MHPRQSATDISFGADVNRCGDFPRGAGHPPVGHQRDFEAAILQHAEERRHLVQFRHAIGTRALEAHHGDKILLQQTGLECIGQVLLILEHHGWRFDDLVFQRDRRNLHHTATEVALHYAQTTLRRERTRHWTQDVFVEAVRRAFAPY
ncbi:hypothetical protein D3C72_1795390 [compost metagenome]